MLTTSIPDSQGPPRTAQQVTVTDINMPFVSMVVFMIKWALAAVPALIILALLAAGTTVFLGGMAQGIVAARDASAAPERRTQYNRDVEGWRTDCGEFEGRFVVASFDEMRFRSCKAEKASLTARAKDLGVPAP